MQVFLLLPYSFSSSLSLYSPFSLCISKSLNAYCVSYQVYWESPLGLWPTVAALIRSFKRNILVTANLSEMMLCLRLRELIVQHKICVWVPTYMYTHIYVKYRLSLCGFGGGGWGGAGGSIWSPQVFLFRFYKKKCFLEGWWNSGFLWLSILLKPHFSWKYLKAVRGYEDLLFQY